MRTRTANLMAFIGVPMLLSAAAIVALTSAHAGNPAKTDTQAHPVPLVANPCPRLAAGSVAQNPPALFSHNGVLIVNFSYQTTTDKAGRTLFCFMTPDRLENPTLHVRPGDHLVINVTNNTPATPVEMPINPPNCGAGEMTDSSMNIHFRGTNTSPTCHQDEVIRTVINSGQTFRYDVHFPSNETPGLYWYHPHIHGISEAAVLGGATGAIVVDGLEALQPSVRGLSRRVFVIRDQIVPGNLTPGGPNNVPAWNLSFNFIPVSYPDYTPAVVEMPRARSNSGGL